MAPVRLGPVPVYIALVHSVQYGYVCTTRPRACVLDAYRYTLYNNIYKYLPIIHTRQFSNGGVYDKFDRTAFTPCILCSTAIREKRFMWCIILQYHVKICLSEFRYIMKKTKIIRYNKYVFHLYPHVLRRGRGMDSVLKIHTLHVTVYLPAVLDRNYC